MSGQDQGQIRSGQDQVRIGQKHSFDRGQKNLTAIKGFDRDRKFLIVLTTVKI